MWIDCGASPTVSFACLAKILFCSQCARGASPPVTSSCQLLSADCSCLYLACNDMRNIHPLCTSLFILDCVNTELEFQVISPAGCDKCYCRVSKVFLSSNGFVFPSLFMSALQITWMLGFSLVYFKANLRLKFALLRLTLDKSSALLKQLNRIENYSCFH